MREPEREGDCKRYKIQLKQGPTVYRSEVIGISDKKQADKKYNQTNRKVYWQSEKQVYWLKDGKIGKKERKSTIYHKHNSLLTNTASKVNTVIDAKSIPKKYIHPWWLTEWVTGPEKALNLYKLNKRKKKNSYPRTIQMM